MKILLVFLVFVSCAKAPDGWNSIMGTRPYAMRIHPDQRYGADSDWSKGFNDGCLTGMESMSTGFNRVNSPKIDGWKLTGRDPSNPNLPHPTIKSSKVYGKGWFDGYEHCTYQYDWWVL